jgi:hypothetical protein
LGGAIISKLINSVDNGAAEIGLITCDARNLSERICWININLADLSSWCGVGAKISKHISDVDDGAIEVVLSCGHRDTSI